MGLPAQGARSCCCYSAEGVIWGIISAVLTLLILGMFRKLSKTLGAIMAELAPAMAYFSSINIVLSIRKNALKLTRWI